MLRPIHDGRQPAPRPSSIRMHWEASFAHTHPADPLGGNLQASRCMDRGETDTFITQTRLFTSRFAGFISPVTSRSRNFSEIYAFFS